MITFSKIHRSTQEELMDDLQLQGENMQKVLTDLKIVNTYLGGFSITFIGIQKLLKKIPKEQAITLLDIGCGDGEMLRKCANKWNNRTITFIGVDANPFIIEEAKKRSKGFNNCSFQVLDIFSEEPLPEFDIALCTLFLHHFSNENILHIVQKLEEKSTLGIVVNDLQRSPLAFRLFKLFSSIFIKNKIAKYDGLVSVARSFRKKELLTFSKAIHGKHDISWRWAFRYLWIVEKENK